MSQCGNPPLLRRLRQTAGGYRPHHFSAWNGSHYGLKRPGRCILKNSGDRHRPHLKGWAQPAFNPVFGLFRHGVGGRPKSLPGSGK